MSRFYYIPNNVQFGTETEGFDARDNSFAPRNRLWRLLPSAFEASGLSFASMGRKHFYTRWDFNTETTIYVNNEQWIGLELKSRILRGTEGLREVIDAHDILAENSKRADGSYSFETNETCSFQIHVSPTADLSKGASGEPCVVGTFTEKQIRNLAHAIAKNETAYKALLAPHRLTSKYCRKYSSIELPDGCMIADILNPAATTLEQITGTTVRSAMISLAGLNPIKKEEERRSDEEPDIKNDLMLPSINSIQFRGKEGVTLSNFEKHALHTATIVNFVSLALSNPYATLEQAKRQALYGPATSSALVLNALHGPR